MYAEFYGVRIQFKNMTSPYLERPKRKLDEVLLSKQNSAGKAESSQRSTGLRPSLLTGRFIVLPCLILLVIGALWMADAMPGDAVEITSEEMDKVLEIAPAAGGE